MKRKLAMLLGVAMVAGLVGCSGGSSGGGQAETTAAAAAETTAAAAEETTEAAAEEASGEGQELEVMMAASSLVEVLDASMYDILDQFEEETGIKVTYSYPGSGYEELMKTRMAANDLPDVFCTHGWAVVRYGEYLLPLNDQPYASDVSDAIRGVVTDDDGNLLVLPSSYTLFGINYNGDVLKEAGVDPAAIKTWSDFEDACEKIKAIGKAPICMGAKDIGPSAQFFQDVCPSTLSDEDEAAIMDGTFDWEHIAPICERYADWVERGFFNTDCLTADFSTSVQMFAGGEGAFLFYDCTPIVDGWSYYPDADLGMIPVPSADPANTPLSISGENLSWGIWKDSENIDAAKKLLEFFASPEIAKRFAEETNSPCGLSSVEYDLGEITSDFENLAAHRTVPVWDRSLPSGMFTDLCTVGQSILSKEPDAVSKGVSTLRDSYNEKFVK